MTLQKSWKWSEPNDARDSISPHLLCQSASLKVLFNAVINAAEAAWDMSCSILLLNTTQSSLHNACSPSLPDFYCEAIEGVVIGENIGSCGAAAYSGKLTIVEDTQSHPNWAPFKDLAREANLIACWSMPILSSCEKRVLGTFACYFDHVRGPNQRQLDFMTAAGQTLAVAIEQRQMQQVVAKLSYFDQLTGLQNRTAFRKHLQELLDQRQPLSLFFLDLDHFKEVNDSLGHDSGDQLIQAISRRFASLESNTINFSRIGGDEFTVIYSGDASPDQLDEFAQQVIRLVNEPVWCQGNKVQVGTSIGIARFPEHGEQISLLMRHADIAMYHAKSNGRNQHCVFDSQMKEALLERIGLQNELRTASDEGQFDVYYQPQTDNFSNQIVSVEALIRWNHPRKGVLPAGSFIESMESGGFIEAIDLWVLETSCKAIQCHSDKIALSVNLSASHLANSDFPQRVLAILASNDFPASRLIFEVTERTLIQNTNQALPVMQQLCEKGVRFSIDDFGTGYSSLNYLKTLPISEVKIDKSFIQGITSDRYDQEICTSLCNMAKNLDLHLVAEGIETPEQKAALERIGCTTVQGYHISYPLPLGELEQLLKANALLGV